MQRMTADDLSPSMAGLWPTRNAPQRTFGTELTERQSFKSMIQSLKQLFINTLSESFGVVLEFMSQLLIGFFFFLNYKILFFIFYYSIEISNK